ncbi:hypothetical protein ACLOJK_039731 [Asimina triloba]
MPQLQCLSCLWQRLGTGNCCCCNHKKIHPIPEPILPSVKIRLLSSNLSLVLFRLSNDCTYLGVSTICTNGFPLSIISLFYACGGLFCSDSLFAAWASFSSIHPPQTINLGSYPELLRWFAPYVEYRHRSGMTILLRQSSFSFRSSRERSNQQKKHSCGRGNDAKGLQVSDAPGTFARNVDEETTGNLKTGMNAFDERNLDVYDRSTPTTTDVGAASCHPPKSILPAPPPWSIFPAG